MPTVVELVKERFGELTPIQKLAMPRVLAGENVLILAPTGSGKCVSGDTIVFTENGPIKIEDVYQKAIEVNSLNPELKVELSKGMVIRKRKSELFKVTTESGREIRVTDDHKFLVLKDGVLGWEMLKNLKTGEYIGSARKINIRENTKQFFSLEMLKDCSQNVCVKTNPDVSGLIRKIKINKGNPGLRRIAPLVGCHRATIMRAKRNCNMGISTYIKLAKFSGYDTNKIRVTEIGGAGFKNFKIPEIDDDLAYFTGLFAGDGNFNGSAVRFTTSSPELLAFFKKYCRRLGLSVQKDGSRKFDYYVCSKALYLILHSLGIEDKKKSANIRIPAVFFRKRSWLAAFIRGLFDTDGSVYGVIEYCTKSKQMAKEIQLALLCFGVLSDLKIKRHKKYGLYYRIFIQNSENILKFVSSIGFNHPEKFFKTKKFIGKASNPNKDVIPHMAKYLKTYREKLGIPYQKLKANRHIESYMYGYRNPTRRGLERILEEYSDLRKIEESNFLKQLSTSDIFWDKIHKIRPDGEDYVFDATVPGNSNFIGNGIILHNTESALLPVLERIKQLQADRDGAAGSDDGIIALYITPLRALSRDLKQRFTWWCDRLGITHDIRTGDTTMSERAKHRKSPPKILLTTVESLQALLLGRVMRRHLLSVKFVIVDEIHDILDNKRGAQLSLGLERLEEFAKFQRIGLTATVANEKEAAKLLFGERGHAVCETGKMRQMEILVERTITPEKKLERIGGLSAKERSLIFVNTRSSAEELGASLKKLGAPIAVHHGSLAKELRLGTEDDFKSGKLNSILCTSSLELGIDIGDVSLVMQNGSPHQVFRLIQRIGRSGHSMEKLPKGIVFPSDFDDMLESEVIAALARNGWMEDKRVERGALDVIAHQLTGLLIDFGRMELAKAHSILSRSYAYGISYDKLRMVALQLFAEGVIYYDEDSNGKDVTVKARPRARQYYSSFLSTIPKTKRFLMKDVTSNRVISSLDEEFVVNLESGSNFLSQGTPWQVIDITDTEVLAQPTAAIDIMVPSWTGEDIPVSYEVAQDVGRMRAVKKDVSPLPDEKTVIIESIEDIIVVHACLGTRINEGLSRLFAKRLSRMIGESVIAVADPYRIMVKLPFALKAEHAERAFREMKNVRGGLEEALENSSLLRFKFLHVGRMFGLLSEDANVSSRFILAMRHSVVYEEAMRSIFFRYFDVDGAEMALDSIRTGKMRLIVESRKKPSYFAKIGLDRISGAEAVGAFEPRERMISAFKENALSKTLRLRCLNCDASRFMHLAGAPEAIKCHKCGASSLALLGKEGEAVHDLEYSAGLIRSHGKHALIALSTYGIGPSTADRILRRLHKSEEAFYLDLIEAQKNFVKNKKYWKL